jgi:hypothetical protein
MDIPARSSSSAKWETKPGDCATSQMGLDFVRNCLAK